MVSSELYPFEGKFLDRNGLKYHYLDEGNGDPLVMVHGNPTWSFYYRNLVLGLRDQYRTIVPDHIGCGRSDKPDDDRYTYTLESRIDDLEYLLEQLDVLRNITLIVHDWGGMIGMGFAHRHPDRIKRLVVMNTAAFPMPKTKNLPPALWWGRNTALGAILIRGFNAFSATAAHICCKRKPLSKELRDAYTEPYNSWANRIATLRFVQDIPLSPKDRSYSIVADVGANLGQFSETPLLICWGMKDFVFSEQFLREWQRFLPHGQVHEFNEAGHYVLEDMATEILGLIREFLAANPVRVPEPALN